MAVAESTSPSKPSPEMAGAKPAPAPMIVFRNYAEEDFRTRVLQRLLPAWAISGAFNAVIITVFLFVVPPDTVATKTSDDVAAAEVKEEEKQQDLTQQEIGLDADIPAATDANREEPVNVDAPVVPNEAIGVANLQESTPTQTFSPMATGTTDGLIGATAEAMADGAGMAGEGGMGSSQTLPTGLIGRSGATKDKMLRKGGGTDATEAAVGQGLAWLAWNQQEAGFWDYQNVKTSTDAKMAMRKAKNKEEEAEASNADKIAATGMALLPFLAAGITHKNAPGMEKGKEAKEYVGRVNKGINWLMSQQSADGSFKGAATMYSNAIGTIALCEAYGMTQDPNIKTKAIMAINYIVKSQADNGSWGYSAGTRGDTSIVGWEIQALRSGVTANLFDSKHPSFEKARQFLISVSKDKESTYGYQDNASIRPSLTAVGLLCRYYMGWGPRTPSLGLGVEYLKKTPPREGYDDIYYYYYATQVMHFFEGPDWFEFWNPKMRELLLKHKKPAAQGAYWPADTTITGKATGPLGTTCLSLLTLEVYYRHLPLYKRATAAAGNDL
jgi:hypothetical protein